MNPPPVIDTEWAMTPDVILFIAAAALSVVVTACGIWLFMRAAREEQRRVNHPSNRSSEMKS